MPRWARAALSWLLNGISDIIRAILDIGDDIGEWLSDLFNTTFGLFDTILIFFAEAYAERYPIYAFADPYPIKKGTADLIPILLPIRRLDVDIENTEMSLTADIG